MKIVITLLMLLTIGIADVNAQKKAKPIDFNAVINEAYYLFKNEKGGKNVDYIPFLDKVNSDMYGIVIVTKDRYTR